jgi:hypothetical protein
MTILFWPPTESRRPAQLTQKVVADRSPESILDKFAADIPGPKHETEAERADRIAMRRAQILSYHPRNAAEAMLATQCIIFGMLIAEARRNAATVPRTPSSTNKFLRDSRLLMRQSTAMQRTLVERQSRPLAEIDNAVFAALGLSQPVIPEPEDRALAEEAFSAVIVALHPAPKMLQ